jgi:hypothetical protein
MVGPAAETPVPSNRRPIIVLGTLMGAMTAAAIFLRLVLPGLGGARTGAPAPPGDGSGGPLTIDAGRPRAWSRIEVRLAGPETNRSAFHFVIGSVTGGDGAVTSVKPLWRMQESSPLESPTDAGEGVYIALVCPEAETPPNAGQWQALGLLVQQLHGRYGLGRIAFDDGLQTDPRTRAVRTVAGW